MEEFGEFGMIASAFELVVGEEWSVDIEFSNAAQEWFQVRDVAQGRLTFADLEVRQ